MDVIFTPELTICGIEELPAQSGRKVTHVLSLLDPELPELEAFTAYGEHHRTTLRFHDIITAAPDRVMPRPDHVESILAFGAIRRMPWVLGSGVDERIEPRWVTQLALSFDHRLIDGDLGSRFLSDIAAVLHDPARALLWA